MEKIKLVIWDLDETFWKGTLSEGKIEIEQNNIEIVKELARRGIICSISSKNDRESAKSRLLEADVWDYFIFPSIDWTPKGQNIKNIIDRCQLRAPNVLFIDDNISNRKEAEHYNPGINTSDESIVEHLLDLDELKGKVDTSLTRLKQYKILEQKAEAQASYTDNHAFLIDSDIRIRFIKDCKKYKERILELVNRTNQLNFTKIRLVSDELDAILDNASLESVCIQVKDRFGDYGICGFYSIDIEKRRLMHFLFSCRILNLGIPAYVYCRLNKPTLEIVPPIAEDLSEKEIDWIKEDCFFDDTLTISSNHNNKTGHAKKRLLLLGGCDLEQMCHYLDSSLLEIIPEFNYPGPRGVTIHKEHTTYLKDSLECTKSEKHEIESLPFCDRRMFESSLFTGDYDVFVFSVLMNYTQNVFVKKNHKYKVAFGSYSRSCEDAIEHLPWVAGEKEAFLHDYSFIGQQTPADFVKDLEWLTEHIKTPIIFINGAEVECEGSKEIGAKERHMSMNKVLDQFVSSHSDRCTLLDMRRIAISTTDLKDNIRHYTRPIYIRMAEELTRLVIGEEWRMPYSLRVKQYITSLLRRIKQRKK